MRRPRDIDTELKALQEKVKQLRAQRTIQLGELVEATGADTLAIEALAGILLAAVEQTRDKPEAVARWTERGQDFFQAGGKKHSRKSTENTQNAASDA
ncbi:conjugal transfer protein TraD [Gluconobacter sp. P1C6_b]|uniref:conjugal transfer protein TraD n=1 Tax=Gluconobacter sp. P1C6_b TaxID=2762619 RepID=UPI001C0438B0|nr:conjugal transfer protein TraD [Gluconobacter sp. P1C6_b]